MSLLRTLMRRRTMWIAGGAVIVLGGAVGLVLFQPWKLWVDKTVEEAAPAVVPSASAPTSSPPVAGPTVLASGEFITHEHATTGRAVVLQLADGSRVLRLEDLDTSNGPDLHVWITDASVKQGTAGWRVFDDGRYAALGRLKGNKGSQNYVLPARVDLAELNSVTIWCNRFNVSFGAAALTLA